MTARIIHDETDVAEGAAWLARAEPRFAHVLERAGPLPLRRHAGGFPGLLRTICGQQVSVASADAVGTRVAGAGCVTPPRVAQEGEAGLRALGLSRQKARYACALAEAGLDFDALAAMPEDEAVAALTSVKGVGVWTAEIYLMFSVGRADVFAAGDLALQEGARMLFELDTRPRDAALREMAAAWSPWRAVAARALWAYYALEKGREGVTA